MAAAALAALVVATSDRASAAEMRAGARRLAIGVKALGNHSLASTQKKSLGARHIARKRQSAPARRAYRHGRRSDANARRRGGEISWRHGMLMKSTPARRERRAISEIAIMPLGEALTSRQSAWRGR